MADAVSSGIGPDTLTGGAGPDIFVCDSTAHIGNSANTRDVITDFQQKADLIDFDDIDAHTGQAGMQHFTWLGTYGRTGLARLWPQAVPAQIVHGAGDALLQDRDPSYQPDRGC